MKSCKATMADRALALGSLQTARADVAAKRSKLMKLRGTPGIRVRALPPPRCAVCMGPGSAIVCTGALMCKG